MTDNTIQNKKNDNTIVKIKRIQTIQNKKNDRYNCQNS